MEMRAGSLSGGLSGSDFAKMKLRLGDLQRQLGSGRKAETYGGLGEGRTLSLNYRSVLSKVSGWQTSAETLDMRLRVADTGLGQIEKIISQAKASFRSDDFVLSAGKTVGQKLVEDQFDQVVNVLNGQAGGRFLYGGRVTNTRPVRDTEAIMSGLDGRDGFHTVLRERMQADLGSSETSPERDNAARGRMTLSATNMVPIVLAEDGVHHFGMKINNTSGAITGISFVQNAGPPASLTIGSATGSPKTDEMATITFALPDGTNAQVTLKVAAADAPSLGRGQFKAGATPAETLENIRVALDKEVSIVARTTLAAASASKAGGDFFTGETNAVALAGPPPVEPGVAKRLVAGPSGTFADAVAYDLPANAETRTVRWYVGDRSSNDARATAAAVVDDDVRISYGMRADEQGFREVLQTLAVSASLVFRSDDPTARDRYQAVDSRLRGNLSPGDDKDNVTSIRIEMSIAQSTLNSARERHTQMKGMMDTLIEKVEGVQTEELAAQILTLQTQLQASYQTTSMISQLSLVQYLR